MTRRGAALENLDRDHAAAAARAEMRWSCRLVGIDRTRIGIVVLRHCDGEQLAGPRDVVGAGRSGEQAVVADAVGAVRQHMEKEAAGELPGGGRREPLARAGGGTGVL